MRGRALPAAGGNYPRRLLPHRCGQLSRFVHQPGVRRDLGAQLRKPCMRIRNRGSRRSIRRTGHRLTETTKKGSPGRSSEWQYRIVRPDGSIRWMQVRIFPVRERRRRSGTNRGRRGGHHRAKANFGQIEESDRRLSDILDNVELVSLILDREARITYCNDYFLALTGRQREQVIGQSFFKLYRAAGYC